MRSLPGGHHDRPLAGADPDDAVLRAAADGRASPIRSCCGSSGYFTGVAGRTYHLDGSAKWPPETRRGLRADTSLQTFAKRLDFVKQASNDPKVLAVVHASSSTRCPKGKPFFLQLCFNDPHRPLDRTPSPQPHDPAKLKLPAHYPDTPTVREDFARYYDEIARFDGYFGAGDGRL